MKIPFFIFLHKVGWQMNNNLRFDTHARFPSEEARRQRGLFLLLFCWKPPCGRRNSLHVDARAVFRPKGKNLSFSPLSRVA